MESVTKIDRSMLLFKAAEHLLEEEKTFELFDELKQNHLNVNVRDHIAQTPLHASAFAGNKELAELLIEAGADVNVKDRYSRTALSIAIKCGNNKLVKFLLEKGANVFTVDKFGQRPLHLATELVGNIATIELLLSHDCVVNVQNDDGKTPFHNAIERNDEDVINLLLTKDINVFTVDRKGRTPLHDAVIYGNVSIVKMILKRTLPENVYIGDKNGVTAVHTAVFYGREEIIKLLLDADEDVIHHRDNSGCPPLHYAKDPSIIKLLIDRGAELGVFCKCEQSM